jgi:Tfp pilus assembly protein FimT
MALFLLNWGHMRQRFLSIQRRDRRRLGYTMVELVLVFTLIGVMTAFSIPKITGTIRASQVNRAATIVAGDLEAAWSISARYRRPMRITCTCGTGQYTVADRTGATVRVRRTLVGDSDLGTMTLTFSEPTTDVFPSGVGVFTTTNAPLVVRVTSGTHTRAVRVTSAGFVRIIP